VLAEADEAGAEGGGALDGEGEDGGADGGVGPAIGIGRAPLEDEHAWLVVLGEGGDGAGELAEVELLAEGGVGGGGPRTVADEVSAGEAPRALEGASASGVVEDVVVGPAGGAVVGELIDGPQAIGIGKIQKVLQNLLGERVPIRNLPHILEIRADNSSVTKEVDPLTEFVRVGLSMGIVQNVLGPDGTLSVIVLDQSVEQEIQNAARQTSQGSYVALDPNMTQRLVEAIQAQLDEAASLGLPPVLLVNPQIRLIFSRLVRRYLPGVAILSYTEVTGETNLRSIGTVTLQQPTGRGTPSA